MIFSNTTKIQTTTRATLHIIKTCRPLLTKTTKAVVFQSWNLRVEIAVRRARVARAALRSIGTGTVVNTALF